MWCFSNVSRLPAPSTQTDVLCLAPLSLVGIILSSLLCIGCEKVIDLNLKQADPVIVIEGTISDQENIHEVHISNTVAFSTEGTANPVTGASVSIREEQGNARYFKEVAPGVYRIVNYLAYPGRTYHLKVVLQNQTYEASSLMPLPVPIDSIGTVWSSFLGNQDKQVGLIYRDPPDESNYYHYLMWVNGVPSRQIFIYNDKYTNGKQVQRNLTDENIILKTGDEVEIEQQSVDEAVYTYFNGLANNSGSAVAPANPISNFSNGALGYFSAYSVSRAFMHVE